MLCDIQLISVGQERPTPPYEVHGIYVCNEREENLARRFYKITPFFTHQAGIHYALFRMDEYGLCSDDIFCSDFERRPAERKPLWISQNHYDEMTPIVYESEDVYAAIREILLRQIQASPIKMIVFQARYQGTDKETVVGPIRYGMFMRMLARKRIYFNLCYIIKADQKRISGFSRAGYCRK